MKTDWVDLDFDLAVEDATSGQPKTKQTDYLEVGSIPLVDQGKEVIGGFTDDKAALSTVPLPAIVFGDHTRCIKYIDFAFGAGADGVKILRPRPGVDARYLYHVLCDLKIPNAGYSRHFKFLRESKLPIPPIEEQRRIASILDAADALRTKRRQALAKLDTLTQAIFIDMFGVSGESTVGPARLSDHAITITKGTTPTSVGFDFADSGVPFVRVQDLQGGTVRAETIELRISEATNKALRRSILKPCDVVISIAGTIGRIAIIPDSAPEMNCNQAVALVRTSPTLAPVYLAAWLHTQDAQQQIGGSRVTGTISNLSLTSIRNLILPLPDRLAQQRFADRMLEVRRLIENVETSASALNISFVSLQQRAFRGEL